MLWFIISVLAVIGMFVGFGFREEEITNPYGDKYTIVKWKLNKRQFISLAGFLICLLGCITKVPANSVGIVYSPFGGTKEQTLSEGVHTKNVFDKVYMISTEVQTTTLENITAQTKDAQYVTSIIDVKYRVNTSNAYLVFTQYRKLSNMTSTLIAPTTQRVLELITTKYNVIDILGEKRNDVYVELEASLSSEFEQYGVDFYSVSIMDMDAGEGIESAIEQEAIAKKAVETAEQNLLRAETEAKQQSVQAQAKQDAAKIEAETKLIQAEAERKANALLTQSLTEEVLRKEWINKWDGKMPTYYSGSDEGMNVILESK